MTDPGEFAVAAPASGSYNATLARIIRCNPTLSILRVRPDGGPLAFQPGQYTTLGLGDGKRIQRAYSFSHPVLTEDGTRLLASEEIDFNEFYITRVDPGVSGKPPGLTPRLFGLGEGARLFIGGRVTGNYTLAPVGADEDVVLAATGTGEAPHNAMIWELLRRGHRGRIVSIVCVRYRADLGYARLHERLPALFPNARIFPLTTREPENAARKMYIQDFLDSGALERELGQPLDPSRTHVFLCGNPAMIGLPKARDGRVIYPQPRGMIEILEQRGFAVHYKKHTLGRIHFEEYW